MADLPPSNGISQIPFLRASYLADQVLADLPPQIAFSPIPTLWTHILQIRSGHIYPNNPTVISQIPTLIAHIWQTRSWEIYPSQVAISQIPPLRTHIWQTRSWHIFHPPTSDFTDSYSENSYLAGQVLADLPPLGAHFTDSYSESSYLDNQVLVDPPFSLCLKWQFHRFLLWELIFGRPCLRRPTLSNGNVTDSYSEGANLGDQVLAYLPSPHQWFHRFLLWEFIFGRPGLGRSSIPHLKSDFTDSYSENSYLAGQVWAYLPQSPTVISQIPTLRVHIWQTRSWQIYLPHWVLILQIPTLRVHIWQPGLGRSNPSLSVSNDNFTDSYSENSYLAGQVLVDLSSQMAMSQIPTLRAHIWQTRSWQIFHPPPKEWFHRFLLWELIFGRSGLGISTPIPHSDFTDSYSESSYLADQVLGDLSSQMAMSQIPTLRAHIWQTRSWQIFPRPPKEWFHRFLLWELIFGRSGLDISTPIPHSDFTDSYSESSYLADQVLVYLPSPHQTVISQIPTLRAHIWQTRS